MDWFLANWTWVVPCLFMVADKIVKLTATTKDDFVLDFIWNTFISIIFGPRSVLLVNSKYYKALQNLDRG